MRIGTGYDVHRLVEGRRCIIGGVDIPFEKGLDGHSDADVLLHAIMDALLGAAALGDIGKWFPDTDPAWEGADSVKLLQSVGDILAEHHYLIENIDATVIAQARNILVSQAREREFPHRRQLFLQVRETLPPCLLRKRRAAARAVRHPARPPGPAAVRPVRSDNRLRVRAGGVSWDFSKPFRKK